MEFEKIKSSTRAEKGNHSIIYVLNENDKNNLSDFLTELKNIDGEYFEENELVKLTDSISLYGKQIYFLTDKLDAMYIPSKEFLLERGYIYIWNGEIENPKYMNDFHKWELYYEGLEFISKLLNIEIKFISYKREEIVNYNLVD